MLRLHEILVARLRARTHVSHISRIANAGIIPENQDDEPNVVSIEDIEVKATEVLEKVRILRVFDFVGIVDGVREIKEELEQFNRSADMQEGKDSYLDAEGLQEYQEENQSISAVATTKRVEIPDSDEEDVEALLQSPLPTQPLPNTEDDPLVLSQALEEQNLADVRQAVPQEPRPGIVVVDNMTNVLSSSMKNNYVQGRTRSYTRVPKTVLTTCITAHALLTPFLRHLTHLTRTHNLCTILINNTTPLRRPDARQSAATDLGNISAIPSSSPYDPAFHEPSGRPSSSGEENPSIFASNAVKPALGKSFPFFADLHLLITSVPKRKRDGGSFYGMANISERPKYVSCVEVLADRWDSRIGRWAAIQIDASGGLNAAV